MNDSGFRIFARMTGLTEVETLRTRPRERPSSERLACS